MKYYDFLKSKMAIAKDTGFEISPNDLNKKDRFGIGIELNSDYFRDGVGYCKAAESSIDAPTLFDFMENAI